MPRPIPILPDETPTVMALEAAKALLYIEEHVPAAHDFEIEKRNEARRRVVEMIDAALAE